MSSAQWPTSRDYVEAIQSPRLCFDDARLKVGEPALDRFGLPTVTSGQFAYVFKINHPTGAGSDAVRCFRSWSHDRELRYRYINLHLDTVADPYLASFEYDPKGIRVRGEMWPTLVMEWIDGHSLDVYLDRVVGNAQALTYLAKMWLNALRSLRDHQIAHGDLQHGNILIDSASMLRIVDLDGMYVPAMDGWSAPELGHRHYQHPARSADHFGPTLDNFSGLVIYLSLLALKEAPELWKLYHDENLFLVKQDFDAPESSPALSAIRQLGGECARLADVLAAACLDDPLSCPSVLDLMAAPSRPRPAWMMETPLIAVPAATREVRPGSMTTPIGATAVATAGTAAGSPNRSPVSFVATIPWWRRPVNISLASATAKQKVSSFMPGPRARLALGLLMVSVGIFLLLQSSLQGDVSDAPPPMDLASLSASDSIEAPTAGPAEPETSAVASTSRSVDVSPATRRSRESSGSIAIRPGSSSTRSANEVQQAASAPTVNRGDQLAHATIGAPRSEADRQAAIPAYERGMAHLGAHRWGDAKAEFRTALRLDGSVAAYHAALGEVLLEEENWAAAAAEFTAATLLDKNNADYRARLKEARSRM